jgi:hypothetical protein
MSRATTTSTRAQSNTTGSLVGAGLTNNKLLNNSLLSSTLLPKSQPSNTSSQTQRNPSITSTQLKYGTTSLTSSFKTTSILTDNKLLKGSLTTSSLMSRGQNTIALSSNLSTLTKLSNPNVRTAGIILVVYLYKVSEVCTLSFRPLLL